MKLNPIAGLIILAVIIAFPIFGNISYYPIRLWDESRVAINALEMYKSGNRIVTTFNGAPDMWNTKPPLLIWIQVLFLKLFGVTDLSIRMVSPLAALATCLFIYWFFLVKMKKPWLGILTCLVLVTCKGYIKLHGVRTGEYDALLVLFTTMYLLYYFLFLQEKQNKYLYAFFISLILACLTKGIAALLFLPAVFLYTLADKNVLHVLRSKHFYIGIFLFIVFVPGYYLLREHYNPGFIDAVKGNEFGGRYQHSDQGAYATDKGYYYNLLQGRTFIRWLVLMYVGLGLGLLSTKKELRRITIYSFLAAAFYFFIVSLSHTKNEWYDLAVYPLLAIVTAVGLYIVCSFFATIGPDAPYVKYILITAFIVLVTWLPYSEIVTENISPEQQAWSAENDSITFYVRDILNNKRKGNGLQVAHAGYQADLLWYQLLLKDNNKPLPDVDYNNMTAGMEVIAFQKPVKEYIAAHYKTAVLDTFRTVSVYRIYGAQ